MAAARGAAASATGAEEPGGRQPALRSVKRSPWGGRASRCERLSGKEKLVLAELAGGHSTDEIGLTLHVSPHTVRTHVKNLMRKLDARTRAHAVAIALSERAIEVEV